MIVGKAIVKGKRSVYISSEDITITEDDVNSSTIKYLTGFMNDKELSRFSSLYPEYSIYIDHIFRSLK